MYNLNDVFYLDKEYSLRAKWCNDNNYIIAEIEPDENGRRFQIQRPPELTQEDIKQNRIYEIESRLIELDQDIIQDIAGEVVPNIEERKLEFIELHNELRQLLGKEQRKYKK